LSEDYAGAEAEARSAAARTQTFGYDPAVEREGDGERERLHQQHEKIKALADAARVAYFGPFGVGDTVSINGDLFAEVVEISSSGVRSHSPIDQVLWYPKENIVSVKGMLGTTPRSSTVDNRVVEDSSAGDESLPMRPPPQMPGAEATFR
jgi:hypothetical protein